MGLTKKQVENLPANIIGITKTHDVQELVGIYSAADVFVNPTLEDNYPTVNLEAQACGTYTVTFDSGGTRETIIDPSHGIVCGEKTTKALRKVLNDIRINTQIDDLAGEPLETGKEILPEISKGMFFQRILATYTKRYRNS